MKNSLKSLMIVTFVLLSTICNAQIKNAKTETVKVYGNCGMCETKIEMAGNLKNTSKIDWNENTKMATLTYDSKKTNQEEILKRIALAGYDSDKFLAPDATYSKLPGCCQYDRVAKVPVKTEIVSENHIEAQKTEIQDSGNSEQMKQTNQLKVVFDDYFAVKDALVKTDGNTASTKAKNLLSAINAVNMETLKMDEHMVWMKVVANLKEDAQDISDTKDAGHQRDNFTKLSQNIYKLIKVAKQKTPTYYQHCPMANDGKGADWLSKENTIKNPYFGSTMLSCGKTVEIIK